MSAAEFEPAVYCLLASLIWAPLVYFIATRLDRGRALSVSEMLWLSALAIAALPTLIAPALSMFDISLRAPETTSIIVMAPETAAIEYTALPAETAPAPAPAITLATVIGAAGLLYLYGVLLAFGVWLTRAAIFRVEVAGARPIDHPALLYALADWRRRLGVSAPLRVKVTPAVSSVCVYGLFRPVILIPRDLNARIAFDDLVMMGAHELAHMKRGDGLLFAACAGARIFFWFNPFVKRIAARAELAAEQNADALVLRGGADRRAYAACFVEGLRFAAERARQQHVAVPSFTPFDRKSRRDRLDAILSGDATRRRPSALTLAVAAVLTAALGLAQAAFAVHPDNIPVTDESAIETGALAEAVTLSYGEAVRDEIAPGRPAHEGVDIKAPRGAPVVAAADGVVIAATDRYQGQKSWGNVVVIEHEDGLVTRYAHLDSFAVKPGERVRSGDKIGEVGSTGVTSGPHLHFETLIDGARVDPMLVLASKDLRAPTAPPPAPKPAATPKPESAPARAATPAPEAAPQPETAPAPAAAPKPAVSPAPADPLDEELAGRAAPAPGPVRLAFADADFGKLMNGLKIDINGERANFAFADGAEKFELRLNNGKGFLSVDGEEPVVFQLDDHGDVKRVNGRALSEEEEAAIKAALDKMRTDLEATKKAHTEAAKSMRLSFPTQWFEPGEVEAIRLKAGEDAKAVIANWKRDHERAMRDAGKAREEALREAARARKHAFDEAARERDEALREAARAREEAMRDADRARRDAQRERREAQRRAEREHGRHELEEDLRERAEALAEAERDLARERAELERLRAKLERARTDDRNTDI